MHANPFVTSSEAAVLPACSLYNHPRRSPGSRSITRECCRSALAWKGGLGLRVYLLGPHSVGDVSTEQRHRGTKGVFSRLAGGLVSRGLRPRSSQDKSLDGHARATRWKRRLRGPFSLLSLLFLIAIFVPEQHAAPLPPIHLSREPGFFSSVVSSVPLLHTSYSALLLISLYLLMNPIVESRYLLRLVLYNQEINEFIRWPMRHDNIVIFEIHAWQIVIKSESGLQVLYEECSVYLLLVLHDIMWYYTISSYLRLKFHKKNTWILIELGLILICKFYYISIASHIITQQT